MSSVFFDILFNPNDSICLSRDTFGIKVTPSRNYIGSNFVSINALKDSRKDDNVVVYRSILCEFDAGTLEEQLAIIKSSELPFSTIVHSGNKSYHAIISLERSLRDRVAYDRLVELIYNKLPSVDKTGRNPSRFSRVPGVPRENGRYQTLIEAKGRVPNEVLYEWLGITEDDLEKERKPKQEQLLLGSKLLPVRTHSFLTYGAPEGLWNFKLFECACEMARAGFNQEETEERVQGINGYLDKSDKRTIKSAYDTVRRDG